MFGMTITLVQAQRLPTRKIRVTIQLSREEAVFKTKPKSLWMIHQLSLLLCLTLGVGSVKAQPVDPGLLAPNLEASGAKFDIDTYSMLMHEELLLTEVLGPVWAARANTEFGKNTHSDSDSA